MVHYVITPASRWLLRFIRTGATMAVRAMAQLRMRRQRTPFQRQSHKPSKDLTPARQDERGEAEEAEAEAAPETDAPAANTGQTSEAEAPEAEKPQRDDKPRTEIRRQPIDRGGRPRGLSSQDLAERSRGHRLPGPRAELVCWKSGLVWVLGVEVSSDPDTPTVIQSDEPLESDMRDPSLYPIRYVGSTVTVCWDGIERHISVGDHNKILLVFKMGKDGLMHAPENGFKAREVEITHIMCDNPGMYSGKHGHMEAVIYILEGEGYSIVEGEKVEWEKGALLQVQDPQTVHQHFNIGQVEAQLLRTHYGLRARYFQPIARRVFPYIYYTANTDSPRG